MTAEMYNLVSAMRRVYGNDADVLRAGIMSLWREFDTLPSLEESPLFPDPGDAMDVVDAAGE